MNKQISTLAGLSIILFLFLAVVVIFLYMGFPKQEFETTGLKIIKKGIMVSSPNSGEELTSPIKIIGYVNGGGWIGFEGQVGTVELVNNKGNKIAEAVLNAKTDWMKPLVYFATTIEFDVSETQDAILVFKNENPSGLPEKNKESRLLIKLKGESQFQNQEIEEEITNN